MQSLKYFIKIISYVSLPDFINRFFEQKHSVTTSDGNVTILPEISEKTIHEDGTSLDSKKQSLSILFFRRMKKKSLLRMIDRS